MTFCLETAYIEHANEMRVRGYALACCKAVDLAKRNLEVATDRMLRARKDAEHALKTLKATVEQAELASRVFMSGDREWQAEVAGHLKELFG